MKFGDNFKMKFTVGIGTFEQYSWQGRGIAASADRRSGEPIAPNFTPMPGTAMNGVAATLESFKKFDLDRFAGGVIIDITLEEKNTDIETMEKLLNLTLDTGTPMLTVSIGSEKLYREIYESVQAANNLTNKEDAANMLKRYAGINVRIGGWQTPFITLPLSHMENYIHRPTPLNS